MKRAYVFGLVLLGLACLPVLTMGQDSTKSAGSPTVSTNKKQTELLFKAVDHADMKSLKRLVSQGANLNCLADGFTLLSDAVSHGNFDVVEFLVKNGADVNAANTDNDSYTPIFGALAGNGLRGKDRILKFLLDKGANINYQTKEGGTALFVAAMRGMPGDVKILLSYGANKDLKCYGKTPLSVAIENRRSFPESRHKGFDDVVQLLTDAQSTK